MKSLHYKIVSRFYIASCKRDLEKEIPLQLNFLVYLPIHLLANKKSVLCINPLPRYSFVENIWIATRGPEERIYSRIGEQWLSAP
jgi:hypothetical protein